jgi:hypothetical protein
MCKTLQGGGLYCIPVPGMADIVMCHHVVESVVRIHAVVEAGSDEGNLVSSRG